MRLFFANERSEVGDEKTSYVDLFPCNIINSNLVRECNPAMYKRVFYRNLHLAILSEECHTVRAVGN